MAGDQRDAPHTRHLHLRFPEPGPGWYGLPHGLESERTKEVTEVVDLLGAGKNFP
jgi:hypothetical protein